MIIANCVVRARQAAAADDYKTIPSVREIDLPILKDWTLEAPALNTHLLFGLALHSPVREQCQH